MKVKTSTQIDTKCFVTWVTLQLKDTEPVSSHEDEGVDGDVGGADDECLVELAPNLAKIPDRGEGVVSSSEGDAEEEK